MARPPIRSAGSLRERVSIERRTRLDGEGDGAGNYEQSWAQLVGGVPASIEPRGAGELVIAGRLTATATFEIWVRSDSRTREIREGDRVVDDNDRSRVWNIRSVQNHDMRDRFLMMQCEQGVAE